MRIILFSGTHSRHIYVHKQIIDNFNIAGIVCMTRESQIIEPPEGLKIIDKNNFIRHFKERNEIELLTYGKLTDNIFSKVAPLLKIKPSELNSLKVLNFVKKLKADACFIFGVDLILDPIINNLPKFKINLHLGLSPWYKGSATLFWPFYFLQPQYAGSTIHFIVKDADAGKIIHQDTPKLKYGQGIHQVGVNVVLESVKSVIKIFSKIKKNEEIMAVKQKSTGRLFLTRDFHPSHLRLIYGEFNNKIVDYYLDKKIDQRKPKLIKLF